MIVEEIIDNKFINRYSDTPGKRLHKVNTNEFYSSALDLLDSPYVYEEVDDPDYRPEDEDSDSDSE